MQNWSTYIKWNPKEIIQPGSEDEIIRLVQKAIENKRKIRIIGTGHSFEPLWVNEDILVNLDKHSGIIEIDQDKQTVRVAAGTKLSTLGDLLFDQLLAQENLGDIDQQSIAGSISTGTHGTGTAFGNLSTQVIALKFVNGKGELIECALDNQFELFNAARLSLGSFGIITELTIKCVPAYRLELEKKKEDLYEVLNKLDQYNNENRNFEYYWLPYTDTTQTKYSNITEKPADKSNLGTWLNDILLENHILRLVAETAKVFPGLNKGVSKLSAALVGGNKKVHQSHKVYATPRYVKFNEMEYNIPQETFRQVVLDIKSCIDKNSFPIHFPIENRFVKEDDIYLSPAFGRPSAYIACHVYKGKPFKEYFAALEEIFVANGGRPHWGKMHTRDATYFAKVYPEFDRFIKIRNEQDPDRIFMSPYLQKILC